MKTIKTLFLGLLSLITGLAHMPLVHAQAEGAAITALVPVDSNTIKPLFTGARFYPGEKVTLSVRGPVFPLRRADYVERCTKRISFGIGNVCTRKEKKLEVVEEVAGGPEVIPLLLELHDASQTPPGAADIGVVPAVQPGLVIPEYANTPFLLVSPDSIEIDLRAPNSQSIADMQRRFTMDAVTATVFQGNRVKPANQCAELSVGSCSAGNFTVRVVEVDSRVRFKAVKDMLTGPQPISAAAVENLVDLWLYSDIKGGKIVRNPERAKELSVAVMNHALKNYAGAGFAKDRQSLFEKALELDPDNGMAAARLVGNLIESGDLVRARLKLDTSLPKLRDAYQDEKSKAVISAAVFMNYAEQLGNAANLMILQRAKVEGNDIRAAVSILDSSIATLDELRGRQVDFGVRSMQEVDKMHVAQAESAAMAGQILRDPASLDHAIAKLDAVLRLLPETTRGYLVGAGPTSGSRLVAETQLVFPSNRAEARLVAELSVLSPRLKDAVAVTDQFAIGRAAGPTTNNLVWSSKSGYMETSNPTPIPANAAMVAGRPQGGGAVFRQTGAGDVNHWLVRDGSSVMFKAVLAVPINDGYLSITDDGKIHVVKNGNDEQLTQGNDPELMKGVSVLASDSNAQQIAALRVTGTPELVILGSSPDKPSSAIALPSVNADAMGVRLAVGPKGHIVVLTPSHLCMVAESKLSCEAHGDANVLTHLVAPGIIPGEERVVYAVRANDDSFATIRHREYASWAKFDELLVPAATDWKNAHLTTVSTRPAAQLNSPSIVTSQLTVPTIPARLSLLGLEKELSRSEQYFAGHAVALSATEIVVRDRSGAWRSAGTDTEVGKRGARPVFAAGAKSVWINEPDDAITEVTIVDTASKSSSVVKLSSVGKKYRHLPLYERDHTLLQHSLVVVDNTDPAAKPLFFNPQKNVFEELAVQIPADALAIARAADGIVVLTRSDGDFYLKNETGSPIKVFSAPADTKIHAKAFSSTTHFIARLLDEQGNGTIVTVPYAKWPQSESELTPHAFAAVRHVSKQRGIGQPTPGFVDAALGIAAIPADGCNLIAILGPANNKPLPSVVSGGSNVLISPSIAYVGMNGVTTITRAGAQNTASEKFPASCKKS